MLVLILAAGAAIAVGLSRGGGGSSTTSTNAGNGKGTGTAAALPLPGYAKRVEQVVVLSHGAQSGLDRVIRDVHDSGRSGVSPAMAIRQTRTLVRARTRAVALADRLPAAAPPELAKAIPSLRQAMRLELTASTGYLRWMRSMKPGADTYPYTDPAYQRARRFERRADDLERRFMVRYGAVARDLKLKSFPPGTF